MEDTVVSPEGEMVMESGVKPPVMVSENDTTATNSPLLGAPEMQSAGVAPDSLASGAAPSPNAIRKRRREEIARKVESRKQLITTASSSRLDMNRVQAILSGPRLSWDTISSSTRGGGGRKDLSADNEDDSTIERGLIIEDFHIDSRSALRTNISKAMSQMASRDLGCQSVLPPSLGSSQMTASTGNNEEVEKIIQMKRRMMASQKITAPPRAIIPPISSTISAAPLDEMLPPLELINEFNQSEISNWQNTQMPLDSSPVITSAAAAAIDRDAISPTQVFVRVDHGCQSEDEEELDMDNLARRNAAVEPPEEWILEPTQLYVPTTQESTTAGPSLAQKQSTTTSVASSIELPPNTMRPPDDVVEEESSDESSGQSSGDESSESVAQTAAAPAVVERKKRIEEMEFEEWLAERKRKKKLRKKHANEAKSFFEAEAEESEDEELGGIMRRRRVGGDGSESNDDSDDEDGDSDLEDLVASAADEFALEKKSKKDSKRLAKMHAKWASERDDALEKAIEDRDFFRRAKRATGVDNIDTTVSGGGLNRLQRKLKARRDALVDQFDKDGNLLAPEFIDNESDYDSMDIDSDEFIDEDWDQEGGEDEGGMDASEIVARKERKERERERRKKEMEFKMEMQKRRLLLKEKLRQERLMREKDKREIQSGLGIMNEEDREVFKMINRSQIFGATTSQIVVPGGTAVAAKENMTTQSTAPFTFLTSTNLTQTNPMMGKSRRRSSVIDFD